MSSFLFPELPIANGVHYAREYIYITASQIFIFTSFCRLREKATAVIGKLVMKERNDVSSMSGRMLSVVTHFQFFRQLMSSGGIGIG